jgi:ribosome-associated protein
MIVVTSSVQLDDSELRFDFIRSAGPGGQNVNKVATAAQLRFDVASSPSLPAEVKQRLARLAGARLNADGVLVIEAKRYRTQEQNRQDAINRLLALIRQAAAPPRPRRATRPTLASQQRRLETKKRRSAVKSTRCSRPGLED